MFYGCKESKILGMHNENFKLHIFFIFAIGTEEEIHTG